MQMTNKLEKFKSCIDDLIDAPIVQTMNNFTQHSIITTLEHSLFVSYISFIICDFMGLNYHSAARGALLHDMFLYDWHENGRWHKNGRLWKLHGFTHPSVALKNANIYFKLSSMEQDIIKKHMWPLTIKLPKYRESYIVSFADKFCCIFEVLGFYRFIWISRIMKLHMSAKKSEPAVNNLLAE